MYRIDSSRSAGARGWLAVVGAMLLLLHGAGRDATAESIILFTAFNGLYGWDRSQSRRLVRLQLSQRPDAAEPLSARDLQRRDALVGLGRAERHDGRPAPRRDDLWPLRVQQ